MKTTSFRENPPAASASRIHSSMGRPMTGTSALGISSVSGPRRLPRPAPITMGRMRHEYHTRMSGELTFGIVTDLHFGPEARWQGKLRKLTHMAGDLTREVVRRMNDEVRPDF